MMNQQCKYGHDFPLYPVLFLSCLLERVHAHTLTHTQIHPPPPGSISPRPVPTLQNPPTHYYNPQHTPLPTFSHQWSRPISAPTGRRFIPPINTLHQPPLAPTGTGFMVQPQQTGGYIVPGMVSYDVHRQNVNGLGDLQTLFSSLRST